MEIFYTLVTKTLPLYFLVIIGFISSRFLNVKRESIASLIIYIIAPVVVFQGIMSRPLAPKLLLIPILVVFIGSVATVLMLKFGKKRWPDTRRNVLAFAAGAANTGYFGLPVAILLFGQDVIQIATMGILGTVLYETTVGFYAIARGNYTPKKSFQKLIKIPILYAFFLALFLNAFNFSIPHDLNDFFTLFRGAYSILGMMIIGIALSGIQRSMIDFRFICYALIAKLALWPLLMIGFIWLDLNILNLYDPITHQVLFLISIVPMAANTVVYATELNARPEIAAMLILVSTFLAIPYIPIMLILFQFFMT